MKTRNKRIPMMLSGSLTSHPNGVTRSALQRTRHLKKYLDIESVLLVHDFHAASDREINILRESGELLDTTEVRNLFTGLRDLDRGNNSAEPGIKFITDGLKAEPDSSNINVVRYYRGDEYFAYANWGDGSFVPVINLVKNGKKYKTVWLDENNVVTRARIYNNSGNPIQDEYFTSYGLRYLTAYYNNGVVSYYSLIDSKMQELIFNDFSSLIEFWLVECNSDILKNNCLISEWTYNLPAIEKAKAKLSFKSLYVFHGSHIFTKHPSYRDDFGDYYRSTVDQIPLMDAAIVLTYDQYLDLRKHNPNISNLFVIPHVMEKMDIEKSISRDKNLVVSVCKLRQVKGIAEFVKVFSRVIQKCPDIPIRFEIYGTGPEEARIRKNIIESNLEDYVFLMGHTSDAHSIYSRASISVFPSQREGQPLSLLESINAGCVPVAFDFKYGARHEILHGVNGLIAELDNYEEIADSVALLLSDSKLLQSMKNNCISKKDRYAPADFARKWQELFNDLEISL